MSESLPWLRLYTDIVDDEKLRLLAFEDRWHYVALLCLKRSGVLDSSDALMRRKVAVKLGIDAKTLDEVARRLAEVGLIDKDTLQPTGWDKRQRRSDADSTNAERQRRYREAKRESNALRNAAVTQTKRNDNRGVTRPDTDTDKEIPPLPPTGGVTVEAAPPKPKPPMAAERRFDAFWSAYPKKIGKDAARKAFERRHVDDGLLEAMLAAVSTQRHSDQWQRDGGQYVPNPATWINQGRWQDGPSGSSAMAVGSFV